MDFRNRRLPFNFILRCFYLFLLFFLFLSIQLQAEENRSGRIVNLKGGVEIQRARKEIWERPQNGHFLGPGDAIRTGPDGWAALLLADETLLQLHRNTTLILKEVAPKAGWLKKPEIVPAAITDGRSLYRLERGQIWIRNKDRKAVIDVETPTVTAGFRGTEFNLAVAEDGTVYLTVLEGVVAVWNEWGSLNVASREEAVIRPGASPRKRVLVSPEDAVQWILTVPPLITYRDIPLLSNDRESLKIERMRLEDLILSGEGKIQPVLRLAQVYRDLGHDGKARDLFERVLRREPMNSDALIGLGWTFLDQKKPEQALEAFEKIGEPIAMGFLGQSVAFSQIGSTEKAFSVLKEGSSRYPDFAFIPAQKAFLHFTRGEAGQARTVLLEAVGQHPRESLLWSLLALTSLVMGQKAEALEAAQQGVRLAPYSPTALIIETYACQAFFDLDRALRATRATLAHDPQNVTALLNLSRLLFGMDDLDEAWEVMEQTLSLAPDEADVQNVRGFLLLAKRKTEEAVTAFKKASAFNPDIGEPHLGLALALMRRGQVEEAMEEITTAVLLEPRRSLFLSYWGKMLYQLKRFKEALDMLRLASDLDTRDPTPYLYRALILRDLNRPMDAIEALNRSMTLNDNRAVYRSRFLLDRDLAVKNVNLALVYSQLGLSDWGKNKATASVKQDYLNSAAHKFLGRALSDLEGYDAPADSETLLARLLQPANLNAFNTFNDYTSFFERPSIGGNVNGYLGNHDTYGGLFRTFGALPQINTAFFGSTLYDQTDGWRDTNSERARSILGLIKWDPTPEDGIALTARNTYLRQEDYNAGWEWDQPSDPLDSAWKRETQIEAGYHRRLSTRSDLLLYATYQDVHGKWNDHNIDKNSPPDIWEEFFTDRFRLPYFQAQGQYHLKWRTHQMILGTLYYSGRDEAKVTDVWLKNGAMDSTYSAFWQNRFPNRSNSLYLHEIWRMIPAVTLHGAAYYDYMILSDAISGAKWSLSEFSPRLGLIFSLSTNDTFRLAAFQYLVPFNSYRIDPTDIAGVVLSHNPGWGSVVREMALVWEHEWSRGFLSVNPFYLESKYAYETSSGSRLKIHDRVKGLEIALNQMIRPGLGIAAGYSFKDVKNEGDPRADREDHRVTAGLTYVHPSGLSASLRQTYRHIDLKAPDRSNENIWLTDFKAAYELPRKRGSIGLELRNIFNAHFNWVTDTFVYNGRSPAREIVSTFSLNF